MRNFNSFVVISLILSFLGAPVQVFADQTEFTHVTPTKTFDGSSEFYHGSTQGKLLIRVMLMGAVQKQGIHYFPENTNLLDAILYSGGVSDTTKLNGITIRRKKQAELIDVELEDLVEDGEALPALVDGDIVTVPWNWRRDVATISLVTGFVSSLAAFGIAMVALAK